MFCGFYMCVFVSIIICVICPAQCHCNCVCVTFNKDYFLAYLRHVFWYYTTTIGLTDIDQFPTCDSGLCTVPLQHLCDSVTLIFATIIIIRASQLNAGRQQTS